jgi:serine/threonine protein kinase
MGSRLASGGQGSVYELVPREAQGTRAVIKFVHSRGEYQLERFRREVAVQASINHPNVLPILAHGTDPWPFYVAPRGVPLHEYWNEFRSTRSPAECFDEAARIILALTKGLAEVHSRDLVHRDIKPANVIILEPDSRPALADFGIVHVPTASRITTRPAGNRFARDLASLYDPTKASPSGDCLCLANLWAWMLAEDPRLQHGNYHWRFHQFIADPRCEIAKTVLAICSEPSGCPKDAAVFAGLLERRFALTVVATPRLEGLENARTAHAIASAQSQQIALGLRSELDVTAMASISRIAPIVDAIRLGVEALTAQHLPAKLNGLPPNPYTPDDLVNAVMGSRQYGNPFLIAQASCGDDNVLNFAVTANVVWHKHPHEDGSKFSLNIQFFHEGVPEIAATRTHWYRVLSNGEVEDLSVETVVDSIATFLRDGQWWLPRGFS